MRIRLKAISILSLTTLSMGAASGRSIAEEAIIIDELSRSEVREQIIRVENDIYSFYNQRNENAELDIECNEIALTGTRLPQRVCEPLFWTKARNRRVATFVYDWTTVAELEDVGDDVIQETEEMNRVYADLIAKYPSFAEALLILEDLKARLEELKN